ncbi:MAG TPA: hypothetical protein VNH11_27820 [Pirellulales bacterium]|nr:hypothetical protein [Pirellulales bacterium]
MANDEVASDRRVSTLLHGVREVRLAVWEEMDAAEMMARNAGDRPDLLRRLVEAIERARAGRSAIEAFLRSGASLPHGAPQSWDEKRWLNHVKTLAKKACNVQLIAAAAGQEGWGAKLHDLPDVYQELLAADDWLDEPKMRATDATDQAPPATGASEQSEGAGKSRAEILKSLSLCIRQAYFAFEFAQTMSGDKLEDREAYDYLHENGLHDNAGDLGELSDYELPVFETWRRYISEARRPLGEQKYSRRANRPKGRSIANADEVERPERDE